MILNKITKTIVFLFLIFSVQLSKSQVLIGLQSNYSGSRSLSLNPALISTSHLYFDVAIANVGLMFFNDYAYMKSNDVMHAIFSKDHAMPTYIIDGRESYFYIYDMKKRKSRNFYESLDLNIISLMYNLNGRQSIGFSLNSRVYSNANNISWEMPLMMTYGIKGLAAIMSSNQDSIYHDGFESENMKMATLEWNEASFSFSSRVYERYNTRMDVGVSVKYLMGYSALALNVDKLDYNVLSDDTIYVNHSEGDAVYSLPIDYQKQFSEGMGILDKSLKRGNGFALDFGFTYTRKKNARQARRYMSSCLIPKIDYYWRFGVSVMDLGFINFNKNVRKNHFYTDERVLFDKYIMENAESFKELTDYMHSVFGGDDTIASHTDRFTIGLPTTIRAHFDYNVKDDFYVSAAIVQPISLFKYSVKATPQILLEPRYESSLFEFSLPLSLKDYKFFSVGAFARIGFLTIGTYNIANYLGIGNANGLDIYVSIKFNLDKGRCIGSSYDACWSSDFGNKRRR